jgi:F-type H+-transporting ATPase subunit c
LYIFARRPPPRPLISSVRQSPSKPIFLKEFLMDPVAAKYIGAGLACLGMAGAGIGLGNLFGQFLSGALRNPSAADSQRGTLLLGFALTEALGIFSLLIALLLLFAV